MSKKNGLTKWVKKMTNDDGEYEMEITQLGIRITHNPTKGTAEIHWPLMDNRPDDWDEYPFHIALDTLFETVLQHVLRGVDITDSAYQNGIEAQIAKISDMYAVDEDDD